MSRVLFFFFLRRRRPPRSTRTDTLLPYTTRFRSVSKPRQAVMGSNQLQRFLGLAQVRFDPFAVAHLAHEYPAEQADTQYHHRHDETGFEGSVEIGRAHV